MKITALKSKGQTFVEFLLVFIVLLAASSGAFVMYKKVWQARYNKTKGITELAPTSLEGLGAKAMYNEYVK